VTVPERLTIALSDRYRLERELGQGGMATVYLAQDLKHDRQVALKVLKPELAAVLGAERFVIEIKTTAALPHPHILPLFDSGEADGFLFYVMPFIDGETLRGKLGRETQLGIDESVRIASDVASALHYAHEHGVIHRDIKPENILLHDGRPMVADFGIALAVSAAAGGRMTETGLSLGTPHYMSPEQATAEKEISARSDVYSLGSVLYEMLTGEPPHMGNSAQQIIMKIITEEAAPVTRLRKAVPLNVAAAVAKSLEKLPADRFTSARAFAEALANPSFATTHFLATSSGGGASRPGSNRPVAALGGLALVASALALWGWFRPPPERPAPSPVTRFSLSYQSAGRFSDGTGSPIDMAPDGSRFVYVGVDSMGQSQLYLRAFDREEPAPVPGTIDAQAPTFSPDGDSIAYLQGGRIRKQALGGGSAVTLAERGSNSFAWGPDGSLWYTRDVGLFRVGSAGAEPELVVAADTAARLGYRWPDVMPDGRTILLTIVREGVPTLGAVLLPDTTVREFGLAGMYPRWVEGGFLVYLQEDGTLFGAPFDPETVKLTGAPVPIAEAVRFGPAFPGKLAVSRTGTVVYFGGSPSQRELVLTRRDGGSASILVSGGFIAVPRFSPEGQRIAFEVRDFAGRNAGDAWIYDLRSATTSRVTFDSASFNAEWMPDGKRLAIPSQGRVRLLAVDGSGVAETLRVELQESLQELQVTPEGRGAVLRTGSGNPNISFFGFDSGGAVHPLLATPLVERNMALSRDGRWLAYTSTERGFTSLFVRRTEQGSGRWPVSPGPGSEPRWGPGGELFYRNADTVFLVQLTPGDEPRFSAPVVQLIGDFLTDASRPMWDVSPDGTRLAFLRLQNQTARSLNVVLHWFDHARWNQRPAGRQRRRLTR
jgi:eukaryotic-like serine/threonine-protein kinase